jgi:hypothetical protein
LVILVRKDLPPRLQKYEHHEEVLGDRNSYRKTDPDTTFMRMKKTTCETGNESRLQCIDWNGKPIHFGIQSASTPNRYPFSDDAESSADKMIDATNTARKLSSGPNIASVSMLC